VGGGGTAGASRPGEYQTAEGTSYADLLAWLWRQIGEDCPMRDILQFGLEKLVDDKLHSLAG